MMFSEELFTEMMNDFKLGQDREAVRKLFWVLDEDESGEIEFNEFVMGI